MFEIWCRDHQIYSVSHKDARTVINQLYPAEVISLLDALVSSHREKIGYPHDDVTNLTIAHVPDDSATLDYNKKHELLS